MGIIVESEFTINPTPHSDVSIIINVLASTLVSHLPPCPEDNSIMYHTIHAMSGSIEMPVTPVPELLGSNAIPSASQTDLVLDTISDTQYQIAVIDANLTGLMVKVDELRSKRDALVHYTTRHSALIAPIRRLPPEVMSEIFLHCMAPVDPFDPRESPRLDKSPLLVSQLCSRWRKIALSTPRLWTSFALTIQPKYLKDDVLLAKTWLGRSGTCPLSIALGSRGNYSRSMQSLTDVFLLHCERWYDIQLSLPIPVIRTLSTAKNRLPMLHSIFIGGEWEEDIDVFECAPQLRRVTLEVHGLSCKVKLPWNQLQYCSMISYNIDRCLEVLHLTSELEECVLFGLPARSLCPVHNHLCNFLACVFCPFMAFHSPSSISCCCLNCTRLTFILQVLHGQVHSHLTSAFLRGRHLRYSLSTHL